MAAITQLVPDLGSAASEVADGLRPSVVEVMARGNGNGAGTVWRADGVIVTNYHVVPGDGASVRLHDGRTFEARTVAQDPANDLAVLRVDAPDLAAPPIGDARALRAGEIVLAIGHPYGDRGTLTVGIVASQVADGFGWPGREREAPDGGDRRRDDTGRPRARVEASSGERELLRAAVLLGPGNSGGPLADARGRVVGINAMVAGGLALAIPSHLVERLLVPESARPKLGVEAKPVELPPTLAASAGAARGLLILGVRDGTPAEQAGVMIGDVLVRAGDEPVGSAEDLAAALAAHSGGPLRLGLLRGGVARELWAAPEQSAQKAA
jgi:serine protease Do